MLFSDNQPHNNGLDSIFTDLGYGEITGDPQDFGLFKTPTLRNVELSAPYMHDGRFNTLMEVINHYNSGGHASPTIDPFMKYTDGGLQLSEQDKTDIIAFLHCLTDTSFINEPAFHDPH
jgi:cytochrome c peroxidase